MNLPPNICFLLVDDFENIRKTLHDQLKHLGFVGRFYEAANVVEAKALLQKEVIQFVISDWNMPGENGIDLLKFVRGNSNLMNLPFLMLTTQGEVKNVLEAVNSGASNYMLKPWEINILHDKIKSSWQKHYK